MSDHTLLYLYEKIENKLLDSKEYLQISNDLMKSLKKLHLDQILNIYSRKNKCVKKVLEEILPISIYIKNLKGFENLYICWENGNQLYDGFVQFSLNNGFSTLESSKIYLEVTVAEHENERLVRDLLRTEGSCFGVKGIRKVGQQVTTECVTYDVEEYFQEFYPIILARIYDKNSKEYPENTVLIISCNLTTIYYSSEWYLLEKKLEKDLKNIQFIEIVLYDSHSENIMYIFKNNKKSPKTEL